MASPSSTVVHGLVLVSALVAVYFSHVKLNELLLQENLPLEASLIPSAQTARLVSLGFDQVLADYYWLQFVGYVGDTDRRTKDRYAVADLYLDLITGLDPNFVQAYWFATFIVGSDQGRPQRAAEIIDRGIEANPDNWYLPFIAGINQYLYAKDEVAAAKYYRMAAKFPGAPDWLERQAKILEAQSPRLIKEAYSWQNIFDSAQDERVKERAHRQCIWLWVQVFKTAPNDAFKKTAREHLQRLGVDIDAVAAQNKK